ncbi:MAG: UDP-N-acetylmuramoyl-L-alanyl-D-glutamate--2,6-diaminopimelate ligase [Candidatus Thiodiazotropha lotti]|uniref:UDP-N-acetylmuramoyl-L-alanyl-D-glutamate--2,6-diaminopimelate ligase n=1 Tax=Candidatus Thiodiazotropha lotti TaxID=2792787 RepID=A0A9E4K1W9_9GAMM|nr:UDP-N-acetylmuramoyl-L-alanyl-D-glutamate--2,6-diaminopimelate ligase [Candidatus Thiodiazotropha lotti]MCG7986058.1 UDP-N-acetylmuramoyl-L-alanyl-D-glutamate--2,6-diaminopimelate ligase [Candidatus Thiodiazotropha lotti]MCG8008448.1 UDP-N-acetylmuramoyl-L-alanyl-D-glutamate--2,6-diaminopimelate ligase [Candidatus Thiodiazotropha lotti]MCG8010577.1 UDP-N-acetylmuramoyl-L-alanyl-D-glutamate--2,6-diaminopimelate ligase [Candidatus Thiodiazotropha lotti]MCW4196037.1 UDP-N-acetylmuramoyl-L-alany
MMTAREITETHWLTTLLAGLADLPSEQDRQIGGLCLDSRQLVEGDLFLACAGTRQHGLAYAEQAIAQGAEAIVWEPDGGEGDRLAGELQKCALPLIKVANLSRSLSEIAGRFYDNPSRAMTLYGITGTNGKTSICQLLAQALESEHPCGMVGTLGAGLPGQLETTGMTTPDAVSVQQILSRLLGQGAKSVAMEVSSHALDQYRVDGVAFDCAIFTNLSRDHFDYHGSLENYSNAKRRLFQLPELGRAVINLDDPFGRQLAESLCQKMPVYGYSIEPDSTLPDGVQGWVRATSLQATGEGLSLSVSTPAGESRLESGLLGRFNGANLLAVLSVLLITGWPLERAVAVLAKLSTVPGRMERFGDSGKPTVVVDYAHTPDALEKALQALRLHCAGQLIVVFGCGGDRDPGKRPMMGEVAASEADLCYLTDDNPRSESSAEIIKQILAGMPNVDQVEVEADRGKAIRQAVSAAKPGDLVLVAGKGHEDYQLVADQVLHFDDREVVQAALAGWQEGAI